MVTNVKPLLLTISLAIAATSCSTLNPKEIQNLNRVAFAPLELAPSVEPTDLRLDVIRQVRTSYSYIYERLETTDVPNDPLGFDIGNGLFYDLNENFSLRLDRLLDFADDDKFVLNKMENPAPNRGFTSYTYENDSLTTSFSERSRIRYRYHRVGPPDSLSYMNGNALDYVIVQRDSSLACRNRRKVKKEIVRSGERRFKLEIGRREAYFVQTDKGIDLQSRYIVELSSANKAITIYRLNQKGRRTLVYTLIRSKDTMYIFNENFKGRKIVFENGGITVFHNKNIVAMYELASAKKQVETSMAP